MKEIRKNFLLSFLNINPIISTKIFGGAENKKNDIPKMIWKGIENARKHGISLESGIKNRADWNCTFESVINNINVRPSFRRKLHLDPNVYRKRWVT